MSRAGWLAFLGLVAACGYTTRATAPDGEDVRIYVPPVQGGEVDLDATARVEAEVRRAVARSAGLRLVLSREVPRLEVTLASVTTQQAAFSEPRLRAAQYEAVVVLTGRLVAPDGQVRFQSGAVVGEAPYLSTAGRIESLDGAGRRAVGQAAERAAERLVGLVAMRLRGGARSEAVSDPADRASPATDTSSSGRSLRPAPPR